VLLAPFVPLPDWLRGSLSASVIVVLLGLGALVTMGRLHEGLLNIVARGERWLWGKDSSRLTGLVQGVLASVANLARRREALAVLVWTALVWFAGAAVNQLLFQATGIHVPWSTTWFLIVVLQIGTRVPALPANLGVFHYLVILALGVYGIDQSAALAYGILLHLIVFILPALIGAICMLPLSARLAQLVASGLPMLIHAKR
jgi:uncharacterized protein (TIRG00374 family)